MDLGFNSNSSIGNRPTVSPRSLEFQRRAIWIKIPDLFYSCSKAIALRLEAIALRLEAIAPDLFRVLVECDSD